MTDFIQVNEDRIREALAEVKDESDMEIPIFLGSLLSGGAGIATVAAARSETTRMVGLGLTGFGTGLSLAEVSAMAHRILIGDNGGERAFFLHHDAIGVIATITGAAVIASEDIPDEIGSFLVGIGAGLVLHHLATELSLDFSDKSIDEIAGEFV